MTNETMRQFRSFLREELPSPPWSSNTHRTYSAQAHQFLWWCENLGLDFRNLGHQDIVQYRAYLMDMPYSVSTIGGRLNAIRKLYRMLQVREHRIDNPAEGLRAPIDVRDPETRTKIFTEQQLAALFSAPDIYTQIGIRDRAILALFAGQALRRMEVAGLLCEQVDLEGPTILVIGKARKQRTLFLGDVPATCLGDWLRIRDEIAAKGEHAVFVRTHSGGNGGVGKRLSLTSINRLVDKYLNELGLKERGIGPHTFRRTVASIIYDEGARMQHVQRLLGHDDPRQTSRYIHILDPVASNPARLMDRLLR